jgi:3-deoxy-manno-octulosonate cytidylyltransferase (CMP-KDO synthetase)
MSFNVIIPARFASTRLPGKPLLDIAGKPMVQHVYERAKQSDAEQVIIATDDERIADVASGFGAQVCMTSSAHESGTDRLQEVVETLGFSQQDIVVNVQGDEPLIPPAVINQVASNLANDQQAAIATLVEKITDTETVFDVNAVKVVMDKNNRALYFSRAPMPWFRDGWQSAVNDAANQPLPSSVNYYRHIGIYAYRVSFLHQFVTWEASPLELTEKLEQLRAMENGALILAEESIEAIPAGVDTEHDLAKVRAVFQ